MHSHYVNYTQVNLATIPFEMLHGSLQFGEPLRNYIRSVPQTFVLRAEVIRAELYQGKSTSKGLNKTDIPSIRKATYDKAT